MGCSLNFPVHHTLYSLTNMADYSGFNPSKRKSSCSVFLIGMLRNSTISRSLRFSGDFGRQGETVIAKGRLWHWRTKSRVPCLSTALCKMMAQTLPQRKLLLSVIFDPMHRLSSNMTQNDRKNNAKISNKKNATPRACIMHKCMHLCAFVTIYALNVINFVHNSLFKHSLVCLYSFINGTIVAYKH